MLARGRAVVIIQLCLIVLAHIALWLSLSNWLKLWGMLARG